MAVVCAAFVQVQPVVLSDSCQCACCHCKVPGACGIPGCRTPTPESPMVAAAHPAGLGRGAARPLAQPGQPFSASFIASRIGSDAALSALVPSALAVPAAHVPLFKAHCSFLI